MLVSLLLFIVVSLQYGADSAYITFKPTKDRSLLFVKQFYVLPLHFGDFPVNASKAIQ